jgi:hypothetical protein
MTTDLARFTVVHDHATGTVTIETANAPDATVIPQSDVLAIAGALLRANGWTAGELRAAARAANGAATIRAAISEFTADEHANPLASEVPPLERVAGKLAQLAETLDGNR